MAYGFKNNASNKIIAYTDTGTGSIKSTSLNTGSNIDTSKLVPDKEETDVVVDLDSMATSDTAKADYGTGPSSEVSGAKGTGYTQTGTVDYNSSKIQADTVDLDKKLTRDEARMNPDFKGQTDKAASGDYKSSGTSGSGSPGATATPTAAGMVPPAAGGGVGAATPGSGSGSASYSGSGAGASYEVPDTGTGDATAGMNTGEDANTYDSTSLIVSPDGTYHFEGVDFDPSALEDGTVNLEDYIGAMSQEDYDALVAEMKKYNQEQIDTLQAMLDGSEDQEGIDSMLARIRTFMLYQMAGKEDSDRAIDNQLQEQVQWYREFGEGRDVFEHGVSYEEFCEMEYPDQLEFLKKYDTQVQHLFEAIESNTAFYDETVAKAFTDIGEEGIKSYDELMQFKSALEQQKAMIEQQIANYKNAIDSAEYDYLPYLESFANYKFHEITDDDVAGIDKYGNTATDRGSYEAYGTLMTTYSYTQYVKDHPDVSPVEFLQIIEKAHPGSDYLVTGIKNVDALKDLVEASEALPNLAMTYSYLYEQDPKKAEQFLKDCKYEINNVRGQVEAKRFLDTLGEFDGSDDQIEAIANYFDVSVEGLKDGLAGFGEGFVNLADAIWALISPTYDGNRARSVLDYKKMYVLQALMPTEAKEAAGLIAKNDTPWTSYEDACAAGHSEIMTRSEFSKRKSDYASYEEYLAAMTSRYATYANTDPNSIIDFTKVYCGAGLNHVYSISQGIGNMLPVIAISAFCPMAWAAYAGPGVATPWIVAHAGSVAMGLSAAGNAYHGAMVDGQNFYASLFYGVLTGSSEAITQWFVGGLPFVSKIDVTSWSKYFASMALEGGQEALQGAMDTLIFRTLAFGEKWPSSVEEWEAWAKDIGTQFVYGAITAGIMNLPGVIKSKYRLSKFNQSMAEKGISSADVAEAIQKIKDSNADLAKLSDDRIMINYGDTVLALAKMTELARTYGVSMKVAQDMYNNNVSDDVAKLMAEHKLSARDAQIMFDNNVSAEIAKIMGTFSVDADVAAVMDANRVDGKVTVSPSVAKASLENDVSIEIAQIMVSADVDAEIAAIMDANRDENGNFISKEVAKIMRDDGVDVATAQEAYQARVDADLAEIMANNDVSREIALRMLDTGASAEVAELSIKEGVSTDIAKIMLENGVSSEIASVMDTLGIDPQQAQVAIDNAAKLQNASTDVVNATLNGMDGSDIVNVLSILQMQHNDALLNQIFDIKNVDQKYMETITLALLEPTLDYYERAAKLVQDGGDTYKNFLTYRTHCEGHVREVALNTLQALKNIQAAIEANPDIAKSGYSSNINMYECFIAGLWHDTGMAASIDGVIALDSTLKNGQIVTQTLFENDGGDLTRGNHSFNSAMTVLVNSGIISQYGVDPNRVALLCFSHSKSNSGVGSLNSAADWSVCVSKIDSAVRYYNEQNPDNPITFANTGGTDFIESLVASGILKDSDSEVTVGHNKKKGDFEYRNYHFNEDVVSELASEAYALRLGDANTNNRNLRTNQGGLVIDTDSPRRKGTSSFVFDPDAKLIDMVVGESGATYVEYYDEKGVLQRRLVDGTEVKIGNKWYRMNEYGVAFIFGENNVEFSTDVDVDGDLVERFVVLDPSDWPASTLFAIDERLGEIDTASKFDTSVEIVLSAEGIDPAMRGTIEKYYQDFFDSRKLTGKVVWSDV